MMPRNEPEEVTALYRGVSKALNTDYGDGRRVGDCKYGVYLFYDYDGEPIYVGRTKETAEGPHPPSLDKSANRRCCNERT